MSYDIDTLRNQLLACQQRSIALDQSRIDAEAQTRQAEADKRLAEERLRQAVKKQQAHRCPPDLSPRVDELTRALEYAKSECSRLRRKLVVQKKSESVNERLQMRVTRLEEDREGLKRRVKSVESERDRAQADTKKAWQATAAEKAQSEKVSRDSEHYAQRLTATLERLKNATAERDDYRARMENSEIARHKERTEAVRGQHEAVEAERIEAQRKRTEQERRHQAEVAELRDQIKAAKNEATKAKAAHTRDTKRLTAQAEQAEADATAAIRERDRIHAELDKKVKALELARGQNVNRDR